MSQHMPWWVYLILGLLVYTAVTNWDGLRANFLQANVDSGKDIINWMVGWFKGMGTKTNTTTTTVVGDNTYLGKPTQAFDCTNNNDCNQYISQCDNKCSCDLSTGECFIPKEAQ